MRRLERGRNDSISQALATTDLIHLGMELAQVFVSAREAAMVRRSEGQGRGDDCSLVGAHAREHSILEVLHCVVAVAQ